MGDALALRLTDGDPIVVLKSANLTLEIASSGDVKIESKAKVEITGSSGIDLKSDGSINIEANGAMTLKGATIDLN